MEPPVEHRLPSHTAWDWKLPPIPPGHAAPDAVVAHRQGMRALDAIQLADPDVSISEVAIGGVSGIEAMPAAPQGTLLYLHGGGYRLGEAVTWAGFASRLAAAAAVRVVVPDYRLAPEYPFPAGLDDALAVYRGLLGQDDAPLFIGGDSAGGGLACSLIATALAAGAPLPSGVMLISPWLDLTLVGESFDRCAKTDATFSRAAATAAAKHYLQGQDAAHLLLSPLRTAGEDFPPAFIAASGSEVLVDDSLALADRLARAGVPLELRIERSLPHGWPILQPAAAETATLIAAMAAFVVRQAAR